MERREVTVHFSHRIDVEGVRGSVWCRNDVLKMLGGGFIYALCA